MNKDIAQYVENLFRNAPKTRKAAELKEEMTINMNEKFNDLFAQGYSENEAYNQVISGIGDAQELIDGLQPDPLNYANKQAEQKKTALVVSVCVGLYILSLLSIAFFDEYIASDLLAMSSFFIIAGISTCILIYHFMSRPKYIKTEETVVEEMLENESYTTRNKAITGAVTTILWTLAVAAFIIISFTFSNWHISWIIFIIAALLQQIIVLIINMSGKNSPAAKLSGQRKAIKGSVSGLIWTLTLVLYFIVSFSLGIWHISWVIFLIAAAVDSLISLIFQLSNNKR